MNTPLILIADDEEFLRLNAEHILISAGYRVATASNGKECVARYRAIGAANVALVITDFSMPVMDGGETLHLIRKIEPRARVLINSASVTPAQVNELLRDGAIGVFSKPYTEAEYLAQVAKALALTSRTPPARFSGKTALQHAT